MKPTMKFRVQIRDKRNNTRNIESIAKMLKYYGAEFTQKPIMGTMESFNAYVDSYTYNQMKQFIDSLNSKSIAYDTISIKESNENKIRKMIDEQIDIMLKNK